MEDFIRMAIYSPVESERPNAAAVVEWGERAIVRGANALLLRHPNPTWIEAVLPALQGVRSSDIHVGVNTDWNRFNVRLHTYDFLHLKSNYMNEHEEDDLFALVEQLQAMDKYVESACHTTEDIEIADYYNLNLVVVSPVFPTASHPEAQLLGLTGLKELLDHAHEYDLPVIALGGIQPEHERELRELGVTGWAAIGAFS